MTISTTPIRGIHPWESTGRAGRRLASIHFWLPAVVATLLPGVAPCAAFQFCVGNAAQLSGALVVAGLNGQDDEIRIRTGTYAAPVAGSFVYAPASGGSDTGSHLAISGGWASASCTRQSYLANATRLEGSGSQVLRLVAQSGGIFAVSNLTIANGQSGQGQGALDLRTDGGQAPIMKVERVRFVGNQGFAALHVESDKMIQVIGSLFAYNTMSLGGGGSAVVRRTSTNGNPTIVLFNTVSANVAANGSYFSGLRLENWGTDETVVVNNIFWGNHGGDVLLFGPTEPFSWNDFGVVDGVWTGTGNLAVDPEFEDPASGDFRLRLGSPMIDSGIGTGLVYPPDWDLLGRSRPVDSYDRGAYEHHPPLLADGFESGDTSGWF